MTCLKGLRLVLPDDQPLFIPRPLEPYDLLEGIKTPIRRAG